MGSNRVSNAGGKNIFLSVLTISLLLHSKEISTELAHPNLEAHPASFFQFSSSFFCRLLKCREDRGRIGEAHCRLLRNELHTFIMP